MSLFCRHNRFVADCPICSKGTVLEPGRPVRRAPAPAGAGARRRQPAPAAYRGPYVSAGPYQDGAGEAYEVRLERVPGGLRLAEWAAARIRRSAPVLAAGDLEGLVRAAAERGALDEAEAVPVLEAIAAASAAEAEPPGAAPERFGTSPGRAGDLREELRVEPVADGRLRIARWMLRPGSGWELQEAPVMLPAARFAEALGAAARRGVLAAASGGDAARRP